MGNRVLVTPVLLRQIIDYNPLEGTFHWREWPLKLFKSSAAAFLWNHEKAGKDIFPKKNVNLYSVISILGTNFPAHRVAWAIHHGKWPTADVDHINGARGDNRICNLREAVGAINQRNRALSKNNTSGHVGVTKSKNGKWIAYILDRVIGTFPTFEDAVQAREKAQAEIPGFTDRHGKPRIVQVTKSNRQAKIELKRFKKKLERKAAYALKYPTRTTVSAEPKMG